MPGPSAARCSLCGASRIVQDDGSLGACSLIGCPAPLHDWLLDQSEAAKDETIVVDSDGTVRGEQPLTMRQDLGGHY